MSEDRSCTTFKLTKKYFDDVEKYSKEYSDFLTGREYLLEINRGKYRISVENIEYSPSCVNEFHENLVSLGADEIVTEIFFDQVGESTFHKIFNSKLMSFNSLKEIKEYQYELDNVVDASKFVFSRDKLDDYAFCRFKCPNKNKREKIKSILEKSKSSVETDSVRAFSDLTGQHYKSSEGYDVEWCRWGYTDSEDGEKREYLGIEQLVENIEFINEQGQFIFVAFDVSGIEYFQRDLNGMPYEEWRTFESRIANTTKVLGSLDGVKHLMTKYRLSKYSRDEINISEPYKTDDHSDVTSDEFWEITYDNS
jgi:hypothetical protein